MAFQDLREFIKALEKHGELKQVDKEVDWNLEVGGISRLLNERSLPAALFTNIKGYKPGFTILASPLNTPRKVAIALGLEPTGSYRAVSDLIRERRRKAIKPVIVDKAQAPCKENVYVGDQVDLSIFPAPILHEGDGGRYLCTWHINVSKDPDTGWVNWGMYRGMVAGKNTLTQALRPNQHMGFHFFRKYKPRNIPMPFAIAIGTEPISSLVSGVKVDTNISEADVAGALREEPVELVKCETVDLEVPATSEIVIEGEVSLTETDWEGPFGEFTGYVVSERAKVPVFKVKAVTHRHNPILPICCPGISIDEWDILAGSWRSGQVFDMLTAEGISVTGVHYPPEAIGFIIVVGVNNRLGGTANIAQRIASRIWGSRVGTNLPYVIVVDEDVDVYNLTEVVHSLATKCHPYRGITRLEHATGMSLMPFLSAYERKHDLGAKAFFDCTWPLEWDPATEVPKKTSFKTAYPTELQDQIMRDWECYGFDKL